MNRGHRKCDDRRAKIKSVYRENSRVVAEQHRMRMSRMLLLTVIYSSAVSMDTPSS
jgi:hypothetical protein